MRCSHVALSLGAVLAGAVMALGSVDGCEQPAAGYDCETPPCCMYPTGHEGHYQSATEWRGDESTDGSQQCEDTRADYSQYDDPQFAESTYQPQYPQADQSQSQAAESNVTDQRGDSDYTYQYEYTHPSAKYGYGKGMDGNGSEITESENDSSARLEDGCNQPLTETEPTAPREPEDWRDPIASEYQPAESEPEVAQEPEQPTEPLANEYQPAESEPEVAQEPEQPTEPLANEYQPAESESQVAQEPEQATEPLANEYQPAESEPEVAQEPEQAVEPLANEYQPAESEPEVAQEPEQPTEPLANEYQPADSNPPMAHEFEESLGQFVWLPRELLTQSDQDLLRTLAGQAEERPETRQTTLVEYFGSLGFEAYDFACRVEEMTEVETLSLADDRPALAALLGVFRLVERGDLDDEQGITLLLDAFWSLPQQWVDGVEEISTAEDEFCMEQENPDPPAGVMDTTSNDDDLQAERALLTAIESLATRSLSDFDEAIRNISQQIATAAAGTVVGDAPAGTTTPASSYGAEESTD